MFMILSSEGRPITEHRKFKRRLSELVDDLTAAQVRKLIDALNERGAGAEAQQLIDGGFRTDLKCPHCTARHIHRHGMARGLQRYKCLSCAKTFNALTGTPLTRLRKRDRWPSFARSLAASESVRAAAVRAGIDASTLFRWRHRFLAAETFLFGAGAASDLCPVAPDPPIPHTNLLQLFGALPA